MTQPVGFCSECSGEVYADVPTKLTNLQGKKSGQNISYCAHCYQVKLHEKLRGDFEYAASDILSGLSNYKNILLSAPRISQFARDMSVRIDEVMEERALRTARNDQGGGKPKGKGKGKEKGNKGQGNKDSKGAHGYYAVGPGPPGKGRW